MMSPFRPACTGAGRSECGLTVAICGRLSGVLMVAMMLPPAAGRVCNSSPVPSSISRFVQSAVRPARSRAAVQGMTVRPVVVAAASMMSGCSRLIKSHRQAVYGSGRNVAS